MKTRLLLQSGVRRWLLAILVAGSASLVTTVRAQSAIDFGDAPPPYPTTFKDNGARHSIGGPRLGTVVDAEADGQPDTYALGDDNNGVDDEDGVKFVSAIVPGQTASIEVYVSNAADGAYLDAWLDFDGNGSWAEQADHIFISKVVTDGVNLLTFPVPATAKTGVTFARFRISSLGDLNFIGAAQNGEVEDYRVGVVGTLDFGDAPVIFGAAGNFGYPTLLSQNGARHRIVKGFMLGKLIDSEPDGQPDTTATGDDINPSTADDEDGIKFASDIVAGQKATVEVTCTMGTQQTGKLNAWMDFNADSDWDDPGEQIFTNVTVNNGTVTLTFPVPGYAAGGTTFARFRLNAEGKLGPRGYASEGEVEDYEVRVTASQDYGDAPAPYPTLLKDDGARHNYNKAFCLGFTIDGEADGQPDANAQGDDSNNLDDEDGVIFTSSIVPGTTATVEVYVTAPPGSNGGILNAWMDFNQNGSWADKGEQIFFAVPVVPGFNNLSFNVPSTATSGATFARFRLSTARAVSYTGLADDGEVEDYQVNISANLDFGDAPRPYPTLLAANGARHLYNPDIFLGKRIDTEPDGQPDANALGDDLNGPDEDGVSFTSLLIPGNSATVQVTASTRGFLSAWIDFNGNGSWADKGEKIFDALLIPGGVNNLSFNVPADAKTGRTFARFRFTNVQGPLDFVGLAENGEVEDYAVPITPDRERCDLDCEGRDFWLTFPGNYTPDPDNPAQLSLCIHGASGTTVKVTIDGLGFTKTVVLPAVQSVMVPLPKAADLGNLNDAVTNLGIHVVSTAPIGIQAFDHARYTTDSYLGLSSSVDGTTYLVQGFGNVHSGVPPLNGTQFALVACASNTDIIIIPSATTGIHPAGVPYHLVLQQGQVYQLRNTNDAPNDLSGTLIRASQPIAVFGSHQNTTIPSGSVWYQDYIVEQLLSVNTWGNEFYTAPLATRSLGDTFRFLAAYDGTTVSVNGAAVATLNRGKFYQTQMSSAAHITSDRPIFVTQYATSSDYDGNTKADPFMLTVAATRHYTTSYWLCTPTNDFPANYAHLIAPTTATSTIQIDGTAVGAAAFTAISGTSYSYARVAIAPGAHRVTGGAPFSASVYGWAEYDSYAHPGCFYFGDVAPPRLSGTTATLTASVDDYPNTPGLVPAPDATVNAQVRDNCSPELQRPVQTPAPTTLLTPGVHTLALTVEDSSGNLGETDVVFTVIDPSPVVIDCPSNIVVNCTSSNGAVVDFLVAAHTTYDTNVTVVSMPPSGSLFPVGDTTVISTATSLAGQSNTCSFKVSVVCESKITFLPGPNGLTLNWSGSSGTLEHATSILGPWTPYTNGVNSITIRPTGSREFFRVRY